MHTGVTLCQVADCRLWCRAVMVVRRTHNPLIRRLGSGKLRISQQSSEERRGASVHTLAVQRSITGKQMCNPFQRHKAGQCLQWLVCNSPQLKTPAVNQRQAVALMRRFSWQKETP